LSDPVSLPVREAGRGRPILFLHGWTCHGGFFAPQFDGLAGEFHLIAPDLPGHGTAPRAGLTIEDAADAVHRLIENRALDRPLIVGWSMGAAVAWSLIARHGTDRLAGLVVVDMSPKVLNDDTWGLGLRNGLDAARNAHVLGAMAANWPTYARAVARNIFADGTDAASPLETWTAAEIARNDPAAMTAMWRSLTAQDFRSLIPEIRLPVLIAHGANSRIYAAATADWMAGRLADVEVEVFEASGHAPHLEEPAAFNAMLSRFLRSL
jgi:pimeloyl-[acyl-carrier protein] methyl ester esterase